MTRREMAEIIFGYIRKNGFVPKNIEYFNLNFLHETEEDYICHFEIKHLSGWKFGMWLDHEESPAIQFFCQNKMNIGKFKPQRSLFKANFTLAHLSNENLLVLYEIKNILMMIKRHPIISCVMDSREDYIFGKSYIVEFFKGIYDDLKF